MGAVTRNGRAVGTYPGTGSAAWVMASQTKELEKLKMLVGWLESSKYDEGTPVAAVAAIQEYGSISSKANGGAVVIPPRPFIRPAVQKNGANWRAVLVGGSRAILMGKLTAEQVLTQLGGLMKADIQAAIIAVKSPALKDSTIKARMNKKRDKKTVGALDKPLIDTGQMLASVDFQILDKTE